MSVRFLNFSSLENYEKRCLEDEEDVKRVRSLSRREKIIEAKEVDELIHRTSKNTDYDEELGLW